MKWKFFREVRHLEQIPLGYGLCYNLVHKDAGIFAPVPWNLIIRSLRNFYFNMMLPKETAIERLAFGRHQEFKEKMQLRIEILERREKQFAETYQFMKTKIDYYQSLETIAELARMKNIVDNLREE